jgi:hypothetical protein
MASGFTIGAFTIGGFGTTHHQTGAQGVPPSPPAGVSFPLAEATMVTASGSPGVGACTASNLGTGLAPTALTSGANTTICLTTSAGGFALGDLAYIVDVQWATNATVSTTFEVQVFLSVSPSAHDLLATSYVQTSATITSPEVAVFTADLTQSSDTSVAGFNVLVTEI